MKHTSITLVFLIFAFAMGKSENASRSSVYANNIIPSYVMGYTNTEPIERINITGTVTDEEGSPLMGVYVGLADYTFGTTTDIDGRYSIVVLYNAYMKTHLAFIYPGCQTYYITIDCFSSNRINVMLLPIL